MPRVPKGRAASKIILLKILQKQIYSTGSLLMPLSLRRLTPPRVSSSSSALFYNKKVRFSIRKVRFFGILPTSSVLELSNCSTHPLKLEFPECSITFDLDIQDVFAMDCKDRLRIIILLGTNSNLVEIVS